jgi:hypothetical protein
MILTSIVLVCILIFVFIRVNQWLAIVSLMGLIFHTLFLRKKVQSRHRKIKEHFAEENIESFLIKDDFSKLHDYIHQYIDINKAKKDETNLAKNKTAVKTENK